MDNFSIFNKNELSYILNNPQLFGKIIIEQVIEYCDRRDMNINDIKNTKPLWKAYCKRLDCQKKENKIIISKTEEAKKEDIKGGTFVLIVIALIFISNSCFLLVGQVNILEVVYLAISLPVLYLMVRSVLRQRLQLKEKLKNSRSVEIFRPLRLQLIENGKLTDEFEIKAINYLWEENDEAGTHPDAILEIKSITDKYIGIDESYCYHELFEIGCKIGKLLNKRLNVFTGNSPVNGKIKL